MLVGSAVVNLDKFGQNSPYYEFWNEHGEAIQAIVHGIASKETSQLEATETQWEELCKRLPDDLSDYKMELQRKYGISESTIDDELEEWPTVF
jgi:hypothetical protein